MRPLEGQLALDLLPERAPTWEDVQKGRARAVRHGAYMRPCRESCLHAASIFGGTCYLFRQPIADGMCPSTVHIEYVPKMV